MLLYLFTLEERGESLYGMPVEGAGVLYLPARDAVVRGSRTMSEQAWRKALDRELVRSGLVLDDSAVLEAMEHVSEEGYRFLPLKVSKSTGAITGDALASAERLGRLGRHIQRVLGEIWPRATSPRILSGGDRKKMPAASVTMPPPATLKKGGVGTVGAGYPV